MSVARTGALPDSYKYIHIAVDSFENRLLEGRFYHESLEEGAAFHNLLELVLELERLFDDLRYPMKSVDQRKFEKGNEESRERKPLMPVSEKRSGRLANFRLQVKYRYYATWQGEIVHVGSGKVYEFMSLLELMDHLEEVLLSVRQEETCGLGKRMCEVVVRNYEDHRMSGDVSHPAVPDRRIFFNEFDLRDQILAMLNPLPKEEQESRIIVPRSIQVNGGNFGPATFAVKVLFRRNGTWQGTLSWKEKHQQVSFRSFLEMLLLMHEAVDELGEWKKEPAGGQLHMA